MEWKVDWKWTGFQQTSGGRLVGEPRCGSCEQEGVHICLEAIQVRGEEEARLAKEEALNQRNWRWIWRGIAAIGGWCVAWKERAEDRVKRKWTVVMWKTSGIKWREAVAIGHQPARKLVCEGKRDSEAATKSKQATDWKLNVATWGRRNIYK